MNEQENLKRLIRLFVDKWNITNELWRKEFFDENNLSDKYRKYRLKPSFGNSGNRIKLPKFPYISFLSNGFKTSNGVYPIIFYDHEDIELEIGLGVSKDNRPDVTQEILNEINSFERKRFNLDDLDDAIGYLNESIDEFERILSKDSQSSNNGDQVNIKNIILYGVPGVGKTHNIAKLIRLIEEGKSDSEIFSEIRNNTISDEQLPDDLKERTAFVTFHQSFGYEDFIEGFRPNEEGKIELVDGVFKRFANKARENLIQSQSTNTVPFQEALHRLLKEKIENGETVKIDLKRANSYYLIYDYNDRTIFFEKQNGDKTHSLSIRTLERMYHEERNDIIQGGLAPYYNPLLDTLLQIKHSGGQAPIERKNYYLIIDEINRGNISKIFGELITLIEEDKRDKLEVTLPYSKEPFSVPNNLYIIGTMNSTDKSIALIDVALRRRFTFLKMEPSASLIEHDKARTIFEKLNDFLKERLGEDHQIGHSYFMKVQDEDDLKFVLEHKIKPLLEEYFYGDREGYIEAQKYLDIRYNTNNTNETDEQ